MRKPEITFWTIWEEGMLAGCGALKQLDPHHGEVKSMRTVSSFRGKGVASQVLSQIIAEARRRGYRRLSLETGSMEFFAPARRLYERFGFSPCGHFGAYQADPNSCFFTLSL